MARSIRNAAKLKWPKGVNNVIKEEELDADELRAGENIDITAEGSVRRRPGYTVAYAGSTPILSMFSSPQFLLFVEGGVLKRRDAGGDVNTVRSGLSKTAKTVFVEKNFEVYYSDGSATGVVQYDGTHRAWGVDRPTNQPTLSAVAGSLEPGTYQVAVTFIDSRGEESGTDITEVITLTSGQGISVTNLPTSTNPDITYVRVYRTSPDGTVLYRVGDLPIGTTSTGLGPSTMDKVLTTQFVRPPPAGHLLSELYGRIFIASESTIYWTEAMSFGHVKLADNFIMLPSRVNLMASVRDGMYVAAGNRTFYWSGDDPKKMQQKVAYAQADAIEGAITYVPGSALAFDEVNETDQVPVWAASNGVILVGLPGGRVVPVTEKRFRFPAHERGAAVFRDYQGVRQVLMSLEGSGTADSLVPTDDVAISITKGKRFDDATLT